MRASNIQPRESHVNESEVISMIQKLEHAPCANPVVEGPLTLKASEVVKEVLLYPVFL